MVELAFAGFPEKDVLEWPIDKFYKMHEAVVRKEARESARYIQHTALAIGTAFGGKGENKYLAELEKRGWQ